MLRRVLRLGAGAIGLTVTVLLVTGIASPGLALATTAPTVTGLSIQVGPTGSSVTVSGTGFTGATAVDFGTANPATFSVSSDSEIVATAPAGSGTVDVTVSTAAGTSATSDADQFSYETLPVVTSITPSNGPAAGGTVVTINGSGFQDLYWVSFGGVTALSLEAPSDTQLVATAPPGSGTVDVTVTNGLGTSATSAADQFTYGVANTPSGTDVAVQAGSGVQLTFASVATAGSTTATASPTDPGPTPAPFRVLGGSFYQIETSATYSGPVTVALPYDPTGLTLAQQQALAIMHLDNGVWTNVTTLVDTTAHLIYGSVAHFSWFALAVDTTPPSTTTNITKAWFNTDVPVVLTATDATSGVATIEYKLNGARSWISATPNAQGQVSFKVTGEGKFTLLYRSIDVAGNASAQHSLVFGIDRHAPLTVVDCPVTWSNKQVALHFCAIDLLSGVAATQSSIDHGATWQTAASRTISAEGQTTVLYRSIDNAGNVGSAHSVVVRIDRTAPVVTIATPAPSATFLLNQVVKAAWSTSDALSGLACTSATTTNGAAIATGKVSKVDPKTGKPVGFTYTVTATDNAGNTTTKTVTYYVTYKLRAGFLAPIDANGASFFKLGSTVTVAFQLTDASGANVSCAAASIAVTQLKTTPTGTDQKPICTAKPTNGTAFVYNATAKQYVYYLGTSGLTAGDYKVTASLDDGSQLVGQFSLK